MPRPSVCGTDAAPYIAGRTLRQRGLNESCRPSGTRQFYCSALLFVFREFYGVMPQKV